MKVRDCSPYFVTNMKPTCVSGEPRPPMTELARICLENEVARQLANHRGGWSRRRKP